MRRLLLLSTSKVHGSEYLQYASTEIKRFLARFPVSRILFIPFALDDHDEYTYIVRKAFTQIGYELKSIHNQNSPLEALEAAEAIYVGGGNTFRLLKTLYDKNLLEPLRKKIIEDGIPYIGASAGTNVATVSIHTTNDMPIVYPSTFEALNFLPFNINPHYLDADPSSKHMGETRAERIRQYHEIPDTPPVLGMREGCILEVFEYELTLKGTTGALLFIRGEEPKEMAPGSRLDFLVK